MLPSGEYCYQERYETKEVTPFVNIHFLIFFSFYNIHIKFSRQFHKKQLHKSHRTASVVYNIALYSNLTPLTDGSNAVL